MPWSWNGVAPLSIAVPMCHFEGFLGEAEADRVLDCAMATQTRFTPSMILDGGLVENRDIRRSRSIELPMPSLEQAVLRVLPLVEEILGVVIDPSRGLEYHFTAHNDGDFYRPHIDVRDGGTERALTFVYYLHRTPRAFSGGALRIFDTGVREGRAVDSAAYRDIEPQHDTVVFFPATARHEVRPVSCPSGEFVDSRFAFNGWVHPPSSSAWSGSELTKG